MQAFCRLSVSTDLLQFFDRTGIDQPTLGSSGDPIGDFTTPEFGFFFGTPLALTTMLDGGGSVVPSASGTVSVTDLDLVLDRIVVRRLDTGNVVLDATALESSGTSYSVGAPSLNRPLSPLPRLVFCCSASYAGVVGIVDQSHLPVRFSRSANKPPFLRHQGPDAGFARRRIGHIDRCDDGKSVLLRLRAQYLR